MKHASLMLRGAAFAAALCAASVPALAQQSQWNKGDSSKQQRSAILKKEINAAYADQQSACKRQSAAKRTSCMKSARVAYQRDLANMPQLLANAPQSEVRERVVSVTPAAPDSTASAPGSTAYGNTGAGTTSSGSSGAGSTSSSGDANASAAAASGSAPASTGADAGTPHSSVTGEGGQSGAMMPEPTKPMQPSQDQPEQHQ